MNPLLRQASAAHAEGRLEEAVSLCLQVLEREPGNLMGLLISGITAAKLGDEELADRHLTLVLSADESCYPAHLWLATVLSKSDSHRALKHASSAIRLEPNRPEAIFTLGACLLTAGNREQALDYLGQAAKMEPGSAEYQFAYADLCQKLGREFEALKHFRRAIRLASTPEGIYRLALLELDQGNVQRALKLSEQLSAEVGESAISLDLRSRVAYEQGYYEEATELVDRAIQLDPVRPQTYALKARQAQSAGDFRAAIAAYDRCINLMPHQGAAYYGIALSKKLTSEDRQFVLQMERVAESLEVDDDELWLLEFALGKAYQDLAQPEAAMRHYDRANLLSDRVHFQGNAFDRGAFRSSVDAQIQLFTPELFNHFRVASDSELPVFIVGMIRSGTTLMEHILSCHPDIGAAGEQAYWAAILDDEKRYLDPSALQANAGTYLQLITEVAGDHPRITDKNPANVLSLGLMHLTFPNARIIHMKRHPVDTMLSIWMTAIRNPPPFACDKENIVFAYRQYHRIMEHWRAVLPSDRFLEIQYEDLVSNQEFWARHAVDFIGLPWNDACTRPERNTRIVQTPSLWQVRQPIHKGSVGKWEAFRPWLGPFAEFL